MLWLDFCIHLFIVGQTDTAAGFIIFDIISIIALIVILWVSYRIGKPRTTKREPEPDATETESVETAQTKEK